MYDHWPYGGYEEYDLIIMAETASVALGLALEYYPETRTGCWDIVELDTTERKVYEIAEQFS